MIRVRRVSPTVKRVAGAMAPVIALILLAIIAPMVVGGTPEKGDLGTVLVAPGREHLLGTDENGSDIFVRVVHAARLDLFIGLGAVAAAFVVAVPVGAWVGYKKGLLSQLIMDATSFLQAFPIFVLALALVAIRGPGVMNVVAVVFVLNIPILLRLVQSEVAGVSTSAFIEAGKVAGASDLRVVFRYVVPHAMGSAIAQASANVGWALLLTAGLGFLGAGIRPPTAEWGVMISQGAGYLSTGAWWASVFPGLALVLTVFLFGLSGDRVQQALDVKQRGSGQ